MMTVWPCNALLLTVVLTAIEVGMAGGGGGQQVKGGDEQRLRKRINQDRILPVPYPSISCNKTTNSILPEQFTLLV
jgi:hypothetical protein